MPSPKKLRLKCDAIPYRKGFIEVSHGIHDDCVNLEVWDIDADCSVENAVWLDDIDDDSVVANCEIEISTRHASQLGSFLSSVTSDATPPQLQFNSEWKVFCDAKTPENAQTTASRLSAKLQRKPENLRIEPYHKGGHTAFFKLTHNCDTWNDTVVDLIDYAQRAGTQWSIHACVAEEMELTTTSVNVPGVDMITCFCVRPTPPNAA